MNIQDETSRLEIVIVGVAQDPGPITPINATQAAHLSDGIILGMTKRLFMGLTPHMYGFLVCR